MTIIPIRDIVHRLPQAGRIRLGDKTAKGYPRSLDKFRFTAASRSGLDAIAAIYGGTPRQWSEPKSDDAWELYSEASEIEVVLPPDGYDACYELWGGSSLQRRCDGVDCVVQVTGPDGPEPTERPCVCRAQGIAECKMKQRLNVILPDIDFYGFWRMDTSSKHAARELPGMAQAIVIVGEVTTMTRAVLRLEQRHDLIETTKGKQRRNFVVPVLGFAATFNEIVAGAARVSVERGAATSVGPPTGVAPRELSPGAPPHLDDEIADAEIVDEDDPNAEVVAWASGLTARQRSRILSDARKLAVELGQPEPMNFEAISGQVLETIWGTLNA